MSRTTIYPPHNPEGQLIAPQLILATGNHLGDPIFNETDSQSAVFSQTSADRLGAWVIRYERPGSGTSSRTFNLGVEHRHQPSRFAEDAAQTGRSLEIAANGLKVPRLLLDESASANHAAAVVQSQTFSINFLGLGGPTGLKQTSQFDFGMAWLRNQLYENRLNSFADQEKTNSPSNWEMVWRAIPEVAYYLKNWRSNDTYKALETIATQKEFGHIAVNFVLAAKPFILNAAEQVVMVDNLNQLVPDDRPSTFRADILPPGTRHSYFNNTQNFIRFAEQTLAINENMDH